MAKTKRPNIAFKTRNLTVKDEEKLAKAKLAYESQEYPSINATAKAYNVSISTLCYRIHELALPKKEAHINQQLLNKAKQETLVDWIKYMALTGHPLNKRTIHPKILAILKAKSQRNVDEKYPSKSWIWRFMKRHMPHLKMSWGSGLNPKCAKAFNYSMVQAHFMLFKDTINKNNIPWKNIYNMDEKGVQMGGGWKGTCTKYFFSRDDKMQYKLQSDKLQLVTIIDCICADGTADIGPSFVFPESMKHQEWFEEPGITYLWVFSFVWKLDS